MINCREKESVIFTKELYIAIKMKKFLFIFSSLFISQNAFANQPVDWQLGFQKAASESMREIVAFHDYLLLPIIIAISVFVLFLML